MANDYFLADDLSGALDAAAAFHRCGHRVRVALAMDPWPRACADEIVGLTTETRNVTPEIASEVLMQTFAAARREGARLLYKKIDSTLRGPIAAELLAYLSAWPDRRVLFAPANPRVGRTVRGGLLFVNGVPLAETEFARDPASPRHESDVRAILGAAATPRVVIPDVETDDHFLTAIAAMNRGADEWLPVGSGGLVSAIVPQLERATPCAAPVAEPIVPASPVLMIGGSAHPMNRTQSAELARTTGVSAIEVTPGKSGDMAIANAIESLRRANGAALLLPSARSAPAMALQAIVDVADATIRNAGVRRVFATGGDTAFAICRKLGVSSLLVQDEVEPGLVVSLAEAAQGTMQFAVKPGGFGDAQTWIRAWNRLAPDTCIDR